MKALPTVQHTFPFVPPQWWEGENIGWASMTSHLGEESGILPADNIMGVPRFPTASSSLSPWPRLTEFIYICPAIVWYPPISASAGLACGGYWRGLCFALKVQHQSDLVS